MNSTVPGTKIPFEGKEGMFSMFRPLIAATDGLTLSQVCKLTGLESSTIQNWVKRGFVSHPVEKKYRERQLARILLISALRESMRIESIGELMTMVNGDADDESDDIISEEGMYDYLCSVIGAIDYTAVSPEDVERLVSRATEDFVPKGDRDRGRLRQALEVMVLAYIAGRFKRGAEERLARMKEESL